MAVSSKIEELILEITKNIGNISDSLEIGIGDINVPNSSIFEINNLKSTASTGYPYFGVVETNPLGFGISYDFLSDRYNVTIRSGTVSYNNSLIKLREQKIPIKKEFLKNYSLDPNSDDYKYGITVGLSIEEISKTIQTFNTVTTNFSSAGSTVVYVNSSTVADSLGYPIEAHVGTDYLKFSASGMGGTALFIDSSFFNGASYGVLANSIQSDTAVKFIFQPSLSFLTGFPINTEIEDANNFNYFPPLPYNWLPIAKILVKQPNDPIIAGITTDSYIRTVVDMPTNTSSNPILGNSSDLTEIFKQCDSAINSLTSYKNSLSLSNYVNAIESYTNSLLNTNAISFNSFWSKQPFRPTQYYSKGVSFSGLERFEFPENYCKAHFRVTNYDPQHTFAIFRGDLVTYNQAVLSTANIGTNEINLNILTTNSAKTSLNKGSQIYGISAVCGIEGNKYQETIPTYKSVVSTYTTLDPYLVDISFSSIGVTNPLFFHIYKRPFTSSEIIEKRLTNANEIIYEPVVSWTPVNDNNTFPLSNKYTALKINVPTNCYVGGFSIKLGFDTPNTTGIGSSTINFAIYEDYDNDGKPNSFYKKTSTASLKFNEISSGYSEFNLKFNNGLNASISKTYWLVIENLYQFETANGIETLKIKYNNSYTNNLITTNSDFNGFEVWSNETGKAFFTLKGYVDDGNIEGYSFDRGIKLFNRIANKPRRLSVYVPNIEDIVDDTGLNFNGSGVSIASTTDNTIKNELLVSVIAKNGVNGTETLLTTSVPQGTVRDTRFLLGTSSDLFDRIVSVSVSPGSNARRTNSGAILWDIYDLITIETEP